MRACEVLCCRSRHDPNRTYHRFPSDPARCKEWLKIIGKKSSDLKVKSVVCSRHFRFKDYYSGGKRLLPSAVPMLRLSSSPKKEKPVSTTKQNEPSRQKNVSGRSLNSLKKSIPKIRSNKFKDVKQSAESSKKPLKSIVTSDTPRNKQLISAGPPHSKTEKKEYESILRADLNKTLTKTNLKRNKISWKPTPKLNKRSPLIKNHSLRSRHRLLCKNNKSPMNMKNGRKLLVSFTKKKTISASEMNKGSTIPINSNSESICQPSSKLEDSNDIVESKDSFGSSEVTLKSASEDTTNRTTNIPLDHVSSTCNINSKSSSDSHVKENQKPELEPVSSSDHRNEEGKDLELRHRRSVKKRKRLVSEDGSDNDNITKKPKAQKCKVKSGVSKKEPLQRKTSNGFTTNKNLSGIEKVIFEMQNKIQMLERKSILDEKRIETFKKALINQRNTDLQILMDEKENELLLRMDLLYLDYDPKRICRLCLQLVDRKQDLTPLFWPLKNQTLLALIKQATDVEVEREEGMPAGICRECIEDIKRVDWLKRKTQKSNMLIKKFVNLKKNSAQNSTDFENDVKFKPVEITSEEEITDEFKIEDVFSLETSPVTFETIQIKQEPESDEESKFNHELNTTYCIAEMKPRKFRRCRNCCRMFKNPRILKIHFQYCSKRFQCLECNKCFLNAGSFRRHKQTMYSCFCAEHLRFCSDCNISFRWKWQLVFHVLRHNTQVCALCDDTIHSAEHLERHFGEFHASY